jgi:hypothetical protein
MERDHDSTWQHLHEDCRLAMFNYLVHGWQPGSFLTAVLINNLYLAAGRADHVNRMHLGYVTLWMIRALPGSCYGSQANMESWMARTDREREELLVAMDLLPTLFEVIRDPDAELT